MPALTDIEWLAEQECDRSRCYVAETDIKMCFRCVAWYFLHGDTEELRAIRLKSMRTLPEIARLRRQNAPLVDFATKWSRWGCFDTGSSPGYGQGRPCGKCIPCTARAALEGSNA